MLKSVTRTWRDYDGSQHTGLLAGADATRYFKLPGDLAKEIFRRMRDGAEGIDPRAGIKPRTPSPAPVFA